MFMLIDRLRPSHQVAEFFVTLSLSALLIWFGLMNISGASASILERWLTGHAFLSDLMQYKVEIRWLLGGTQTAAGLVIILHSVPEHIKRYAYWYILVLCAFSLSLLFTNPVWMKSLGGFPAIGSGQGLLKYLTIAGLALWCLGKRQSKPVMLAGLILVLGWIGAMKFTIPEADGIEPLIKSSPVFNWWLPVYFDKLQASYFIGVVELITVVCLSGYWWNRKAFLFGLFLAAGTFAVTLSFMVSYTPTWNASLGGFPYLSSAGHFLLKDLPLLAACCVLGMRSN
jgi:uncharacterized membrane protein YkgB